MKIAYLDCPSGISGDMTLGALVDAGVPLDVLNEAVGSLGLPGCRLVAEARITVTGAVMIGDYFHLSDAVIGSTIMAVGTSLPELVTCVVAAVKGHHDISVGNLVGSNIFNTLLVTGIAGVVLPFSVQSRFAGGPDYWMMVGMGAGFALAIVLGKRVVGRLSGALLLVAYGAYLAYLLAFTETSVAA